MWMDSVRDNNGNHIELQSGKILSDAIQLPNSGLDIVEDKENYIARIVRELSVDENSLDAI